MTEAIDTDPRHFDPLPEMGHHERLALKATVRYETACTALGAAAAHTAALIRSDVWPGESVIDLEEAVNEYKAAGALMLSTVRQMYAPAAEPPADAPEHVGARLHNGTDTGMEWVCYDNCPVDGCDGHGATL